MKAKQKGGNMQLQLWQQASNYIGEDFSEYYVAMGRSRDSGMMTESNFEACLERLGGESDTVIVAGFNHWACGWGENILVHKSDAKAVAELKKILKELDAYPLLNEDDFYERESEYMERTFNENEEEFINAAIACLKAKTDVPPTILESLKDSHSFAMIVEDTYRECCAYSGTEDGWLTESNFANRFLDSYGGRYANEDLNIMRDALTAVLS